VHNDTGAAFDAIADGYDDNDEHARIAGALIGLVAPLSAGCAVDVASGTGAAAFAALQVLRLDHIAAIDISAGMLRTARKRTTARDPAARIHWLCGGALPLPVKDGSVDLVMCASSLHFLGPAALPDWQRVLRPGGQAVFSLPAASSFRPSPQFRRLLPAPGIRLPETADDAGALLHGTGLSLLRAIELPLSDPNRRAILIAAARA
jgi:ubiquinone/menaquinone biosynthesis C-methylase UbiE